MRSNGMVIPFPLDELQAKGRLLSTARICWVDVCKGCWDRNRRSGIGHFFL